MSWSRGPDRCSRTNKVVILGRGASGKSTFARRLGAITGLPVVELDQVFWRPGFAATPQPEWKARQRELVEGERWILDGDLGPYDVPEIRLAAADAIVLLDFPLWRCAWRALRRSPERADFWWWLIGWRLRSLPPLMRAIAVHAADARLYVLRSPRDVDVFLASSRPTPQCT
jgi:hypothetical protein